MAAQVYAADLIVAMSYVVFVKLATYIIIVFQVRVDFIIAAYKYKY